MHGNGQTIVQHIREHAGDALQAVLIYDADQHRDLYRRQDVEPLHDSPLEDVVLEWTRSEPRTPRQDLAAEAQGELRATVRVFDDRVVLHLPRDDTSGTVVVLDVSAAQQLVTFVSDIRADLYQTGHE